VCQWVYPFEPEYGLLPFTPRVQSILFLDGPSLAGPYKKMSRIFEALKHAHSVHAGKTPADPSGAGATKISDRRRSRRWARDISVYVYGHGPGKDPFHEEAQTLSVNANGALLLLSVPVQMGQTLLLTNQLTQQEQDCRVVFLGTKHSRTVETGVAFPRTNPDFWQAHPTPEDKSAA
jgi:hypothetical protein